jgi:hypothetical protein
MGQIPAFVQLLLAEFREADETEIAFAARAGIDAKTWRRWKEGGAYRQRKVDEVRRNLETSRRAQALQLAEQKTVATPIPKDIESHPVTVEVQTRHGETGGVRMEISREQARFILNWDALGFDAALKVRAEVQEKAEPKARSRLQRGKRK